MFLRWLSTVRLRVILAKFSLFFFGCYMTAHIRHKYRTQNGPSKNTNYTFNRFQMCVHEKARSSGKNFFHS